MKYNEATKLIKGLSKKYSIDNKSVFKIIYKSKPIAWVDKLEQFNFGRCNTLAPEFAKMPYSPKLYMILAELAMTPLDKRVEHKWNVIVGNDDNKRFPIFAWRKDFIDHVYTLSMNDSDNLTNDEVVFTDEEFSDLIKYIKTLPDGEYQAKVAEHGKTEVKGELK